MPLLDRDRRYSGLVLAQWNVALESSAQRSVHIASLPAALVSNVAEAPPYFAKERYAALTPATSPQCGAADQLESQAREVTRRAAASTRPLVATPSSTRPLPMMHCCAIT